MNVVEPPPTLSASSLTWCNLTTGVLGIVLARACQQIANDVGCPFVIHYIQGSRDPGSRYSSQAGCTSESGDGDLSS